MSKLKFINIADQHPEQLPAVCSYITSPSKTNDGLLIGGHACLSTDASACMRAIKKLYRKGDKRQFIHLTMTPTTTETGLSDIDYLELAREIAEYFHGYQSLYAVHKDTYHPHIHLVINSVNFISGNKFSQSKLDLNRFRAECNNILSKRRFDIIRDSANSFYENVPYLPDSGFECLELNEDAVISCDNNVSPYNVAMLPRHSTQNFYLYPQYPNRRHSMRNFNNNNYNRNDYMPYHNQSVYPVPATNIPMYPQLMPQEQVPTITIKSGSHFNITNCSNDNMDSIKDFIQTQAEITSRNQYEAANLAQVIDSQLKGNNVKANVCIDISPTFDIDFGNTNSRNLELPNMFIDTTLNEEDLNN